MTILSLLPIKGVRIATAETGIKYQNRPDLVLFELCETAQVGAVFTQNAFCAAPVSVAKQHLQANVNIRYLLINAGNANAGTGEQGLADAKQCCRTVATQLACQAEQVLPFSTGVIGEYLSVEAIEQGIEHCAVQLDSATWEAAAQGILTTDTVPKAISHQIDIDGQAVTITGITKGSGMICPDMATMLAFIATDAVISPPLLQQCLGDVVATTFNKITVDGDTSTNDACVLIASCQAQMPRIDHSTSTQYKALQQGILWVCEHLAQAIVLDGEGATKLITIDVRGGASVQECERLGYTVAHSPLVKTACFASDPNWGRILAAVGRSGIEAFDLSCVNIYLNEVCIVAQGQRAPEYTEQQGQAAMQHKQIVIRIELGRGDYQSKIWSCDLSYDYVKINAEYRT